MDKENNRPYARDGKPYVRDAGWAGRGPLGEAALSAAMVMLALAAGFAVGFLVWAVLSLANGLVALLWDALGKRGGEGFATPWFPLVVCTLGGLVIGVWTHFLQGAPAPLETVMASFKKTGSYRVEGAGRSVVGFLLPIVFGGSVGPEAGLTGLIASACCRLRDLLKRAGLRAGAIGDATIAASVAAIFGTPLAGIVAGVESAPDEAPDPNEYELRRSAKTVLYFSAALAALGGASASSALFGGSGGLPRLAEPAPGAFGPIWFLPCIAFGYVLALVFEGSSALFSRLSRRVGDTAFAVIAKPTAAGLIMGGIAAVLPNVLFSGEVQTHELVSDWSEAGAFVLLATGVLKSAITPMCLNMGWSGGHFFPCIYSGVSCGFGIALLAGVDSTFAAGVVTTSFIACTTRKPLLSAGILLLCFPLHGMLWCGLAAVIGSLLPLPRARHAGSDAEEEIREL